MNQKTVSYRTYSLALSKLQAELDLDRTEPSQLRRL